MQRRDLINCLKNDLLKNYRTSEKDESLEGCIGWEKLNGRNGTRGRSFRPAEFEISRKERGAPGERNGMSQEYGGRMTLSMSRGC